MGKVDGGTPQSISGMCPGPSFGINGYIQIRIMEFDSSLGVSQESIEISNSGGMFISGLKSFVNNELSAITKLRSALSLHVSICEEISQRRGQVCIKKYSSVPLDLSGSIHLLCYHECRSSMLVFPRISMLFGLRSKTSFREQM